MILMKIKKRSTLISKEVKGYFTTSGDDNSILYDTLSDEIYIYSDNGNEYLMDGKDILVINTFYNTGAPTSYHSTARESLKM